MWLLVDKIIQQVVLQKNGQDYDAATLEINVKKTIQMYVIMEFLNRTHNTEKLCLKAYISQSMRFLYLLHTCKVFLLMCLHSYLVGLEA